MRRSRTTKLLVFALFAGLTALAPASRAGTQSPRAPGAVRYEKAPADTLRVVLLGTAGGPQARFDQFGISTLVEAGDDRLLFDCGRGATLRLAQLGVPMASVDRLFLTHLHSDHIVQVPDLLVAGWASGRVRPLEAWGPAGTRDMMQAFLRAFQFDIRLRRDVDEKIPGDGINVIDHEVTEGTVFERGGLRVTAFLVDHGPVAPVFGYRVDFNGRSVVLSGDTRPSDNLVRHAAGTDVLIHSVIDVAPLRAMGAPEAAIKAIVDHHSTPEQAADVFSRVKPKLAVYSHANASPAILEQTKKGYGGRLQGPEDLLTIDIGSEVTVRRFGP